MLQHAGGFQGLIHHAPGLAGEGNTFGVLITPRILIGSHEFESTC